MGKLDRSAHAFRQALRLQPENFSLQRAAAVALREAGFREEARSLCKALLIKEPDSIATLLLLGNILQELDDFDASIETIERSIALGGCTSSNLSCLAIARFRRGDLEQAIAGFRQSLAIDPQYADGHFHLGMALLLAGEYRSGWDEYEWRPGGRRRPMGSTTIPLWNGDSLRADQTLLLVAEQGLGDTLQFVRFVAALQSQWGCRTILQSQGSLLPLLESCDGIDRICRREDPLPPVDCYLPLASLPSVLGFDPRSTTPPTRYLRADLALIERWRSLLPAASEVEGRKRLRIGIAWQGDPKFPADRSRSIPLAHFRRLFERPGTTWISLQKGFGADQIGSLGLADSIVDFGDRLDADGAAFLDTAAILHQLDLVITSDTAVAHLAGAMGIPVWIALSYVPDWRWNLHRAKSDWYASARLFRQPKLGDWTSVFESIRRSLQVFPPAKIDRL